MDAKPQRPRVLRLNDENKPPTGSQLPLGKTLLHSRTRSSPALSSLHSTHASKAAAAAAGKTTAAPTLTHKKVLGNASKNTMLSKPVRDDSEVGKISPAKAAAAAALDLGILAHPGVRPLAYKPVNNHLTSGVAGYGTGQYAVTDQVNQGEQQALKVAPKKSIKVFQTNEAAPYVAPEVNQPPTNIPAAPYHTAVGTTVVVDPVVPVIPEVQVTESVPSRAEHAVVHNTASTATSYAGVPQGYNHPEYAAWVQQNSYQAQQVAHIHNGAHYVPAVTHQQYYENDDETYYADDGYTTARSLALHGESTGNFTMVNMPNYTERTNKELVEAQQHVESTRTLEDIEDDHWDQSMVAEYSDEIFTYLRHLEEKMHPNPRYMDKQNDMHWGMRGVLMDWVIQVHNRFNLLPETLFLTANFIDRFLTIKVISVAKLQLVGATALYVAAKYEEVQCPTIHEMVYMVDGGYTTDELLKAERYMLSLLGFELGWPGPMSFLRRISKADDYDLETRTLAKYFLEMTLMDERFLPCTPSFVAAGAHCMARLMLAKGDWSLAHVYYSQYTYSQLYPLLCIMLECVQKPDKHHAAVYDKFTDKRYKRSSLFVAGQVANKFSIPTPSDRATIPLTGYQ